MGTHCAPLVADLFLLCCERDFMTSLSGDNQAYIIDLYKFKKIMVRTDFSDQFRKI